MKFTNFPGHDEITCVGKKQKYLSYHIPEILTLPEAKEVTEADKLLAEDSKDQHKQTNKNPTTTTTTINGFNFEGHVSPFFLFWVCGGMFA